MKRVHFLAFIIFLFSTVCSFASCGSDRTQHFKSDISNSTFTDRYKAANIEADLRAYEIPAGVDPELFAMLADKLKSDFEKVSKGRTISQGTIETQIVEGSYIDNGDGSFTFTWDYYNIGDYDLSGEVAVPDITPIANNYLNSTTDGVNDRFESFIDGDGSGEVGISDITPIATNYLRTYGTISGFFLTAPENSMTSDEFLSSGMFAIKAGFTPQGVDRVFVLDEDPESDAYGQLRLTFQTDQIPESAGEYVYVIRDVNDPPTYTVSIPFVVGNPGPPVVSEVAPLLGGVGEEMQFSATVAQGLPPFTYAWDFGGGTDPNTSTDISPTVTLGDEGQYNCSVTVTNEDGDTTFDFVLDVVTVPIVNGVSPLDYYEYTESSVTADVSGVGPFTYEWSFGGGADPDTSTDESPVFTPGAPGQYDASVTVTNSFGSTVFDWTMNVLDRRPYVYDVSPLGGYAGERIQLNANVSGLEPIDYEWNFGTAATVGTSTNVSPMITLTTAGTHNCSLTVSNGFGSHVYPFEIVITEGTPEVTDVTPTYGIAGSEYSPVATVTGIQPLQYAWNFGGGAEPNQTTEANPTVTLSSTKGDYDCSLTLLNALGEDTYNFTLVVQELPVPPVISSVTPTTGDSGSDITLTAECVGSYPRFWSWDFDTGGDPDTSTQESPTITLQDPGTYKASVTLTNGIGEFKYDFDLIVLPIPGQWTTELVDGGTGLQTGMYIDMDFLPSGYPLIAYQAQVSTTNYIAKTAILNQSGSWDVSVLDTMNDGLGGYNIDVALDTNGNQVIAYEYRNDGGGTFYNDLKLAWWNGSSYDFSTVDSDGNAVLQCAKNISLDFGPSGKGFIAHWQMAGLHDPFDIRSVIWDGTSWTGEKIGENAWEVCGILDSSENPLVACTFDTTFELRWFDGSAWQPTVLLTNTDNNISNISMAIAPDSYPSIAWYDYRTGDLFFAHYDGSDWVSETVETWNDVGKFSSLAYSPAGKPYISYFNETRGWLQMSKKESTTWVRTYVDKGGRTEELVGKYSSLAFAPDGLPRIAYWQYTQGNFGVRYATLH